MAENKKINPYGVGQLNEETRKAMQTKETYTPSSTYEDYINEVYGATDISVDMFSAIKLQNPIPFNQFDSNLGIIHTMDVKRALAGNIITNPNRIGYFDSPMNRSIRSNDTQIGKIGSYVYGQMMQRDAFKSSFRRRDINDGELNYSYLTPYLFYEYGNNEANMGRLADIFPVNPITGKAVNYLSKYGRLMDVNESTPENNGSHWFLIEQFKNTKKYVGHSLNNGGIIFDGEYDGDDANTLIQSKSSNKTAMELHKDKTQHFVYDTPQNEYTETISEFDQFYSEDDYHAIGSNNLLAKTKRLFNEKKINSSLGEYYNKFKDGTMRSAFDSAYDSEYGNAKGRNLFKKNVNFNSDSNGYNKPYCRVWTFHSQYAHYRDAIRPLKKNKDTLLTLEDIQGGKSINRYRSFKDSNDIENGGKYLAKYSVLRDNGFVKIGTFDTDRYDDSSNWNENYGVQKFMLSIENLAWKDFSNELKKKERNRLGPNGGRIMWFPPYGLEFDENVSVSWIDNNFIGRGEPLYTYGNTVRTGTLSFVILVDHPSIVDTMAKSSSETDIDADILRYFAGCDTFEFVQGKEEEKKIDDKQEEIELEIGDDNEAPICKFAVFFPNNYSGHRKSDGANNVDQDWIDYIMMGRNTIIPNDDNECVGYEMSVDRGLTNKQYINEHIAAVSGITGVEDKCKDGPENGTRWYYYAVDCDLKQNGLNHGVGPIESASTGSYIDSTSFSLNSKLNSVQQLKKYPKGNIFENCNYSFAEFIGALSVYNGSFMKKDYYMWAKSRGADTTRMDKLIDLLKSGAFTSMSVIGGATEQDKPNANELAKRRRNTLKSLISSNNICEKVNNTQNKDVYVFPNNTDSVNTIESKMQRCAVVALYTKNTELFDAAVGTVVPDNITDNDKRVDKTQASEDKEYKPVSNQELSDIVVSTESPNRTDRYGEYEYFKELKLKHPFVFKSIKDKFSYFDPAYHSMSPEGFNARLNFLHQCTRQGHTISVSDLNTQRSATAGNLAFGRMPVCVLRIGDFINTRMIIQSMSIQYSANGMTWDLNPEGIGVQPMYAKVNMTVALLGGSALNMPVNRLQNAQSFNYYANTGVFDERADRVRVNDNGEIIYDKVYVPTFNNDNNR